MQHITFGSPDKRHALLFGNNKINLHIAGAEFEPKAANVQTGSADLCFVVEDPLEDVLTRFREANVDVLEGGGIVARTGATGAISSVYVRDPDGNLIE
jgi:catechol 2,3-dioxygenase-like lactoylglutathione lyase family enzyme